MPGKEGGGCLAGRAMCCFCIESRPRSAPTRRIIRSELGLGREDAAEEDQLIIAHPHSLFTHYLTPLIHPLSFRPCGSQQTTTRRSPYWQGSCGGHGKQTTHLPLRQLGILPRCSCSLFITCHGHTQPAPVLSLTSVVTPPSVPTHAHTQGGTQHLTHAHAHRPPRSARARGKREK